MDLKDKKCVPCEVGGEPLSHHLVASLLAQLNDEWSINDAGHIERHFKFKDFEEAIRFVGGVAVIAQEEGHHPTITISYNKVSIELWTHAVHGLTENDFIMACKIEGVTPSYI